MNLNPQLPSERVSGPQFVPLRSAQGQFVSKGANVAENILDAMNGASKLVTGIGDYYSANAKRAASDINDQLQSSFLEYTESDGSMTFEQEEKWKVKKDAIISSVREKAGPFSQNQFDYYFSPINTKYDFVVAKARRQNFLQERDLANKAFAGAMADTLASAAIVPQNTEEGKNALEASISNWSNAYGDAIYPGRSTVVFEGGKKPELDSGVTINGKRFQVVSEESYDSLLPTGGNFIRLGDANRLYESEQRTASILSASKSESLSKILAPVIKQKIGNGQFDDARAMLETLKAREQRGEVTINEAELTGLQKSLDISVSIEKASQRSFATVEELNVKFANSTANGRYATTEWQAEFLNLINDSEKDQTPEGQAYTRALSRRYTNECRIREANEEMDFMKAVQEINAGSANGTSGADDIQGNTERILAQMPEGKAKNKARAFVQATQREQERIAKSALIERRNQTGYWDKQKLMANMILFNAIGNKLDPSNQTSVKFGDYEFKASTATKEDRQKLYATIGLDPKVAATIESQLSGNASAIREHVFSRTMAVARKKLGLAVEDPVSPEQMQAIIFLSQALSDAFVLTPVSNADKLSSEDKKRIDFPLEQTLNSIVDYDWANESLLDLALRYEGKNDRESFMAYLLKEIDKPKIDEPVKLVLRNLVASIKATRDFDYPAYQEAPEKEATTDDGY